jgi:serine protease
MATPHVAGLAALVLSANPSLSAGDVRQIIETTARDLGPQGRDDTYGWGLIDASAAVREARRRAGESPSNTPRLTLSTSSLDFGSELTELRVGVSNTGGGTLAVTNIVADAMDGAGWLTAAAGGTSQNTNVTQIVVTVDRTNLADGAYRGRVVVQADGLASQTVEVRMAVGAAQLSNEPIYVLAVDPATLEAIGEATTDRARGFEYLIADLPPGRYVVYAGTDRDKDGQICGTGDLCGALPSTIEPAVIELTPGQALTAADFAIALQVVQNADGASSTAVSLRRIW